MKNHIGPSRNIPGIIRPIGRRMRKIHPDKSRGQNFLIDKNVLSKIVAAAELKPSDTVIEIGAGTGILTAELAKRAGQVITFEIDRKLAGLLKENLRDFKNVEIKNEDVLNFELRTLNSELILKFQSSEFRVRNSEFKVVANIPYNITSAVLEKFLSPPISLPAGKAGGSQRGSFFRQPSLMVLLVQREVAERICARPGEMSVLSVMVQYYGKPEIIAVVPSSAFWPRPKVESAILKIKDIKEITEITEIKDISAQGVRPRPIRLGRRSALGGEFEKFFFQIVKAGFSRRRKMLKNNLKEQLAKNKEQIDKKQLNNLTMKQFKSENRRLDEKEIAGILKAIGLPPSVRPQELGVEDWVKLAKELENLTTISQRE